MSEPVSAEMKTLIQAKIQTIEAEEDVRILLAIESGSRAWGFHSPDSDYDVRFVYARPKAWHYSLGKKRDVIEYPIDDELDLSGWELRKALELMVGSNAVIGEWLQSPIVYQADPQAVQALTEFARTALDRKAVTWHYVSLAQRQMDRLEDADGGIRLKRFFYILRPVLSLRWMRLQGAGMPPMNMQVLRQGCELSVAQSASLDQLTAQKMAAREKATTAVRDNVLDALVAEELSKARDWLTAAPSQDKDPLWDRANALHLELSA